MLQEFHKVSTDLPAVRGKGPVPFAPVMANMVPLVMRHQIATAKKVELGALVFGPQSDSNQCDRDALVSSIGVKGKSKRVLAPPPPRFAGGKRKKK